VVTSVELKVVATRRDKEAGVKWSKMGARKGSLKGCHVKFIEWENARLEIL
jgi:hypothetical protein